MTAAAPMIAAQRFGLGLSARDISAMGSDPRGWVASQLLPQPLPGELKGLPNAATWAAEVAAAKSVDVEALNIRQAIKLLEPGRLRQIYIAEAGARTRAALASNMPVHERIVRFWSNHFTVSTIRPVVVPVCGAFEREAIRPHAFGKYRDLLGHALVHPAMLLYLDNAQSIGPGSKAGVRRGRGLNENLAREALELHSVGVDGGYGQDDVSQLAKVLTGWTVGPAGTRFEPRMHEPGAKRILGRLYEQGGADELARVLDDLAAHPATANFIATKLARHFVADDPGPDLVARIARTFRDTDGDLQQVMLALIDAAETWAKPLPKAKSAEDYLISVLRFAGAPELEDAKLVQSLTILGQPPLRAPSPAGWPDRASDWISPEGLMLRLTWAQSVAKRLARSVPDPGESVALVPFSATSRQAVGQARDKADRLFMVFATPEFQRR